MARTVTGTATTSPATLTITGNDTDEVYVKNTGSVALQVNVPAVHGDDYDTVDPGDTGVYGSPYNISEIKVKTASSTTTYTAAATRGSA